MKSICEKQTGLKVINLAYRDRKANLDKIRNSNLGSSSIAKYLKDYYKKNKSIETKLDFAEVIKSNEQFLPNSKYKTAFQKYATTEQKLKDPAGYRDSFIEAANELLPKELNQIRWLSDLHNPLISSTAIRPARATETSDIYGAVTSIMPSGKGKYRMEIIFSNRESESVPYLIPLLVHELQHASQFEESIRLRENKRRYFEFLLVDEARGNDLQMQAYVELIKKEPQLFCNWLMASWYYGEIMIPLSWRMSSMEDEMASGKFMVNYAMTGIYKAEEYLLNDKKTALQSNLREEIKKLKLHYIKQE
ncbi:MAG: hypothetical protein ACAH59_03690 [Pseudobdellovibrionaceae bacterium]